MNHDKPCNADMAALVLREVLDELTTSDGLCASFDTLLALPGGDHALVDEEVKPLSDLISTSRVRKAMRDKILEDLLRHVKHLRAAAFLYNKGVRP